MTALTLLLGAAATHRLTRLAVTDDITGPLRARLSGRPAELAACVWCASVWAGGLVAATHTLPGWAWVCAALGFSSAASLTLERS